MKLLSLQNNGNFSSAPALIVSAMLISSCVATDNDATAPSFRWASTGGGWRSMVADMGFGNLFRQAGLIPSGTDAAGSQQQTFSAISVNSGASWFGTQFFYSQQFFDRTAGASDPQALYDFVVEWMDAYSTLTADAIEGAPNCTDSIPDVAPFVEDLMPMCQVFVAYDGDWAAFVSDMLNATSSNSYDDPGFVSRAVDGTNRIDALQGIDFISQSTLAPQSRIRSDETLVNLGPDNYGYEMYSVVLPARYTASAQSSGFTIGGGIDGDLFDAYSGTTSPDFNAKDFSDYYLYPGTDGTIYTAEPAGTGESRNLRGGSRGSSPMTSSGMFSAPFGGKTPTTAQIASISSAAAGSYSPLVPSVFAQMTSMYRDMIKNSGKLGPAETRYALRKFDQALNQAYNTPLLDDIAVCSQWPEPCSAENNDGRFMDGGFTDNPAFAMNIAQYQQENSLDTPLKIVLTNTNHAALNSTYEQSMLLSYFNTTFNTGVEPGQFVWAPGQKTPWASSQIFDNEMDFEQLESLLQPIENSTLTTAVIDNLTTLDNPIYGVQAGQRVDVLLININNDIPNGVIGVPAIEYFTPELADLAANQIASNAELLERVQQFFYGTN